MSIRKKMPLWAITLLVAFGTMIFGTSFASAAPFRGACGGGHDLSSAIAGWKAHGVLDDVAKLTGQTPGLDGSAEAIVRQGIVKVVVVKGGYVSNSTCRGGAFKSIGRKKYIPSGAILWVPEKDAPAPCTKGKVKTFMQGLCGNKQNGNLLVKRPCKKSPKPPVVVPPTPPAVTPPTVGQNPVQTNTAEQNCLAKGGKYDKVSTTCSIIQVNGNCSFIVVVDGNNNVISTAPVNINCITIINPLPPVDRRPTISNDGMTAHTMVGDNRQLWFVVTDPDGDNVDSFNIIGVSPYAHVAGIMAVTTLGSNLPCPAKSKCFTATLWADSVPSGMTSAQAVFTAIASANGKDANPLPFSATIIPAIL